MSEYEAWKGPDNQGPEPVALDALMLRTAPES